MSSSPAEVHPVDQRPPLPKLTLLGLQHMSIMYAGSVAVPLVVGSALKLDAATIALLVNADLLVAGIATLIQAIGIGKLFGVRLPVVAGATFTVVNPMIMIASQYGMQAVYGAMLASGVFGLLIAKPFAKMIRFFPPLVSGTLLVVIGISLLGPGVGLIAGHDTEAPDYARPANIALAFGVIAVIILFTRVLRGFANQIGPLLALVIGLVAAIPMGLVSFKGVADADWFGLASPFHFGPPTFPIAAVLSMCVVMLVTYTESTADLVAVGEITGRPPTDSDLARGLATDGLSAILGGAMNSFPDTAFAQNVGLVRMTGVRSRWVVAMAGGLLVLMGLVPKVGAFVSAVPEPVVGAVAVVMFAMVAVVGVQNLKKVEFSGNHNTFIVAVSFGVGLLPAFSTNRFGSSIFFQHFPSWLQTICGSPITVAAIVAFTLNLLFNHLGKRREPDLLKAP
ncbi:nucleobase:cation symporter-2 family protein [Amycolatopsis regifaucium]|uniref:Uracil permease n=1 Tax=Amycolatopsis regifaucium TaxID=546365 RepID=A0A154MB97_9PSEU|nr:nucleobase:cation symporter-2 family protein [Amycolatopsis regifaucium]KZB81822.1 uracil permease [Amycolatopsis regifaucium]OKA06109.1 uracil permease [Amycolatopsis regifaucium]SFG73172.1 nucleobase:cation symporter-2, NCS2 family [Amycolatopsis regifaucium]